MKNAGWSESEPMSQDKLASECVCEPVAISSRERRMLSTWETACGNIGRCNARPAMICKRLEDERQRQLYLVRGRQEDRVPLAATEWDA